MAISSVMVVLEDGTHCLIPEWMLDSAACTTIKDEARRGFHLAR